MSIKKLLEFRMVSKTKELWRKCTKETKGLKARVRTESQHNYINTKTISEITTHRDGLPSLRYFHYILDYILEKMNQTLTYPSRYVCLKDRDLRKTHYHILSTTRVL